MFSGYSRSIDPSDRRQSKARADFLAALGAPAARSEESSSLPGWLIARFAEMAATERARKAEVQEAADHAAHRMKLTDQRNGPADAFLRKHSKGVSRGGRF